MKKLISVMLVLCMVMVLVPAMAFAADGDGTVKAQVDKKNFDSIEDAIDYAGVDGHSTRIDLVADDVEPGVELIIDKDIQIQLCGHNLARTFVIESKSTVAFYGPGVLQNGVAWENTTIYNHGTVEFIGGTYWGGMVNFGKMTFGNGDGVSLKVEGFVENNPDGKHDGCTVTVNGGTFTLHGSTELFYNYGSVTLNGGTFSGKLHHADSGAYADIAPVVNAGVYTDVDAALHATKPVAGMHFTSSDMYKYYMVSEETATSYIKTMVANKQVPCYVDFLYGDMNLSGMPKASDGVTYYNMWNSNYTASGEKVYGTSNVTGLKGTKLDGRGLVNGLSDFTIVAKKVDSIFTPTNEKEQVAADLLTYNQACVKSVEAKYDRTNANEVWVTVTVSVDVKAINPFSNPYAKYGNLIGPHKWIPIAIGFKGLNDNGVRGDLLDGIKAWNMITTGDLVTDYDADTTYMGLWVSGDHNDIGGNSGFEFVDTNKSGPGVATNILYHVDIVIKDINAGIPDQSEPDDKDNAETYPGDGKDKPATSTPAGTGAGDGPAKTGDNSTVMLWATLLVASAAGVAICVVDEAKKRSRK